MYKPDSERTLQMRFLAPTPLLLLLLTSCIADQKQTSTPTMNAPQAPTVNIPGIAPMPGGIPTHPITPEFLSSALMPDLNRLAGVIDTNTHNDVATSSNNTQQQLSGLVTTQVAKLAESIKGVEATLTTNLAATATATVTATAKLDAKLDAVMTNNLNLQNSMQATLSNAVTATAEMKVSLDHLSAQVQAQGSAIAGFGNRIEQTSNANTAGNDVNYFPKEAVEVMLAQEKTSNREFLAILGFAQLILLIVLRNSRERERLR